MRRRWIRRTTSFVVAVLLVSSVALSNGTLWGAAKVQAAAANGNLIVNGDFESGDLNGWDTSGNSKFQVTGEEKHTGAYGLEVGGPQNWNGIKYAVDVTPNTDYTLTFYGKGAGGAAYKVLAGADEASITENYTGEQSDWTLYTVSFNSGANASIKLYVSDANEAAYYDDFELIGPVEEPAPAPSANLIQNGDFESGDLTGWNTSESEKFSLVSEGAHQGNDALRIDSDKQDYDGMKNTVGVQPNTDYTLTFYMKGSGGSYYKVLAAGDETTIQEGQTTTSADWRKIGMAFNSGNNSSVIVYVSDMAGNALFDDFTIAAPIAPDAPRADQATVSGPAKVTGTLTGTYTYSHPGGVSEGYSIYTWLQADSIDGEYTRIEDSYAVKTFVLTAAQTGKYIKFQVQPLDSEGVLGEAATSEPIGPITAASMLDQLNYQIGLAENARGESVEGDAIGQYPTAAVQALEQAIDEAKALASANPAATEEQIRNENAALMKAMEDFDQARVKKASSLENFITATGTQLMDGDKPFRFISYNYPGALFNEDEAGGVMPTAYEQEDAIRSIKQMGGKVFRTYALTVRTPSQAPDVVRHIMGPGVLNEEAFRTMDKLLELANEYGVRMIIPFMDHWEWAPGGISDLAAFRGIKDTDIKNKAFYTNPVLLSDYKLIMDKVLNRINTYTGVRYKDDPAILAWETGNELMVSPAVESDLAAQFKRIDTKQLFMDGNLIEYPAASSSHDYKNITDTALNDPNIDIVQSHYYSGNYAARTKEDMQLAASKGKPFVIGEFGLKPTNEVESMLSEVISDGASGALMWSLRPHSSNGGYIRHNEYDPGDGIVYSAYHWPGLPSGDYQDETHLMHLIREKAYAIDGQSAPTIPAPEPAPQWLPTDSTSKLRWLGSTGAESYTVERSESADGPWMAVGENVRGDVKPGETIFSDLTARTGAGYYYRVKGVNGSGESGYSDVMGPLTAKYELKDTLEDGSKQYYSDDQSVVYRTPGPILSFQADVQTAGGFTFFLSADGIHYTEVAPTLNGTSYVFSSEEPANAAFLRIVFPNGDRNQGRLTGVKVEYRGDGSRMTPIEPLVQDGVLADDLIDWSHSDSRSDNLAFAQDNAELAGQDRSRLVRTSEETAYIQYRSLGDMNSVKLEAYQPTQPGNGENFKVYGSTDGTDYSEIQTDIRSLGGNWYKTNVEVHEMPEGIRFLRIVFPSVTEAGTDYPQISRIQIGVGSAGVSFPSQAPTSIIDNGEYYGGESLLVDGAYEPLASGGGLHLGLDADGKNDGAYGLKLDFHMGTSSSVGVVKSIPAVDRSDYDTLHFWVKPDGYERRLVLKLGTADGQSWSEDTALSGTKARYVNLPITGIDMKNVTTVVLVVQKGDGGPDGTIYIDDLQFIQTRIIDSFDNYDSQEVFAQRYGNFNPAGNLAAALTTDMKTSGTYGLKLDYNFGTDGYAGIITSLPHVDWTGYDKVRMWVQPNGSAISLSVQVRLGTNEYMEAGTVLDGSSEGRFIEIPFSDFNYPSWYGGSGTLDPSDIEEFNLYLGQTSATASPTGSIYIDQIELAKEGETPSTPSTPTIGSTVTTSTSPTVSNGTVTVQAAANEKGEASVSIDAKDLQTAIQQSGNSNGTVAIKVNPSAGTKDVMIAIPIPQLIADDNVNSLRIESGLANVMIKRSLLEKKGAGAANLQLTVAIVDPTTLPEDIRQQLGGRSVYDFNLSVDGGAVRELDGNDVQVSIPYPLDEAENPNQIVVYYVCDSGKLEVVKNGKYDAKMGGVAFTPKHFSRYTAMYAPVTFRDLALAPWAADAIGALAARGAIEGVGKDAFDPGSSVTRAGFVKMLMSALDLIDASASAASTFADVDSGSWYAQAVAGARKLGIANGKPDGTFGVNDDLTREEMAVLVYRAARVLGLELGAPDASASFKDADKVHAYASAAVASIQAVGLIQGMEDGRFLPQGRATRAQAAVMIYRLFDKLSS